jgi:hypothetical protein
MPSLAAADLTHQGGWEHGAAVGMGSRAPVGCPRFQIAATTETLLSAML